MCSNIFRNKYSLLSYIYTIFKETVSQPFGMSSQYTLQSSINPLFWVGFIDGEGSFSVLVTKRPKNLLGWGIMTKFQITLHIKDYNLLVKFREFLDGVGSIYTYKNTNRVMYVIDSSKDMNVLIKFLAFRSLERTRLRSRWIPFN